MKGIDVEWKGRTKTMIKKYSTMNLKHSFKDGFTMVELSLSLVFIAILSIAVVLVMTGAISSYHRSITLNKVENVGASLVRDMKASIQNAPPDRLALLCDDIYANTSNNGNNDPRKKCVDDGGKNFASVTRYAYVKVNKNSEQKGKQMPVFGALCTGSYTYIWNSGYFFDPTSYEVTDRNGGEVKPASFTYKVANSEGGNSKTISQFKLLKVKDQSRKVCESAIRYDAASQELKNRYVIVRPNTTDANAVNIDSNFNMTVLANTEEEPIRYLESDDGGVNAESDDEKKDTSNLAVYDMSISVAEQSATTRTAYYYGSFILGTVRGGINVEASGNFCATPEGYNESVENLDYCAINKFNFAALATGG